MIVNKRERLNGERAKGRKSDMRPRPRPDRVIWSNIVQFGALWCSLEHDSHDLRNEVRKGTKKGSNHGGTEAQRMGIKPQMNTKSRRTTEYWASSGKSTFLISHF